MAHGGYEGIAGGFVLDLAAETAAFDDIGGRHFGRAAA